jgi:hypothetical protein
MSGIKGIKGCSSGRLGAQACLSPQVRRWGKQIGVQISWQGVSQGIGSHFM